MSRAPAHGDRIDVRIVGVGSPWRATCHDRLVTDKGADNFIWTGHRDEDGNLIIDWRMSVKEARRRARIERARTETRFANAPFPLYGLPPDWEGTRFLGGGWWGGSPGREQTKALSLVHGTNIQGDGPMLAVETSSEPSTGGDVLETVAGMIRSGHAPDVRGAIEDLDGTGMARGHDPAGVRRDRREFVVDSDATTFDLLAYGEEWVAWAEVGRVLVMVTGNPFDPNDVELVRVTDLEPYVHGSRQHDAP